MKVFYSFVLFVWGCALVSSVTSAPSDVKGPGVTNITTGQIKNIGDEVELRCITEKTEGHVVIWSKINRDQEKSPNNNVFLAMDSTLIIKDDRFSSVHDTNTSTYIFKIRDIRVSDTGIYECQITISSQEKVTASVELLVRHPPVISDNQSTISVTSSEKQPVNLICHADGFPKPSITWRRQNNALLPIGGQAFSGNELTIKQVRSADRGVYLCIADNGVGSPAQKNINLEVEFAPIINTPRPKVAQAVDHAIELECKVAAYPPPSVIWSIKSETGGQLSDGEEYGITNEASMDQVTSSVLRIRNVAPEHYGDFYCRASNKIGNSMARLNVFDSVIFVRSWQVRDNVI